MFCPKCGKDNPDDNKFCRACGENLQAVSNALKPGWHARLLPLLDRYIRYRNRRLNKAAREYPQFWWVLLILILFEVTKGVKSGEAIPLVVAALIFLMLLGGGWNYITYQRLLAAEARRKQRSTELAALSDAAPEAATVPTTNELAPPPDIVEPTTRRLDPANYSSRGELR